MSDEVAAARYGIDAYLDRVNAEGVPVVSARSLAMGIGNVRYPFTMQKRQTMIGDKGQKQRSSMSIKQGGNQIEFEDQDPRIHAIWLDEMKKAGITPRMEKYFIA